MNEDAITAELQASENIAWFAVDTRGHLGAFESCGFAWIHPRVLTSNRARILLLEAFKELKPSTAVTKRFDLFQRLNVDFNEEKYLKSASFYAIRGLFVYDVPFLPDRSTVFLRIVEPKTPLVLRALPVEVQRLVAPIVLPVDFQASETFVPPSITID